MISPTWETLLPPSALPLTIEINASLKVMATNQATVDFAPDFLCKRILVNKRTHMSGTRLISRSNFV